MLRRIGHKRPCFHLDRSWWSYYSPEYNTENTIFPASFSLSWLPIQHVPVLKYFSYNILFFALILNDVVQITSAIHPTWNWTYILHVFIMISSHILIQHLFHSFTFLITVSSNFQMITVDNRKCYVRYKSSLLLPDFSRPTSCLSSSTSGLLPARCI